MTFRPPPGSRIRRSNRSPMKKLPSRRGSHWRRRSSRPTRRACIRSRIKTIWYSSICSPRTRRFLSRIKLLMTRTIRSRSKRETSKKSSQKWRRRLTRKSPNSANSLASKRASSRKKWRKTTRSKLRFRPSMSRSCNSKIRLISSAPRRLIWSKKSLSWVNMITNWTRVWHKRNRIWQMRKQRKPS